MPKRPSLAKIITIDYAAFVAWLSPVVMWTVYLALRLLQPATGTSSVFPVLATVITAIAIVVLAWRIRQLDTVFREGVETSATIRQVTFYRDRGRVEYGYTFRGQPYVSGTVVHKVKATQALRVGDHLTVLVDRTNPKRAYLRDLYL